MRRRIFAFVCDDHTFDFLAAAAAVQCQSGVDHGVVEGVVILG
jgi:hypothetical protein